MDVPRMSEPGSTEGPSHQDLLRIYEQTKTIALVGASADERKAAHVIPSYLQSQGYRIIPVNPRGGVILGEHVYPFDSSLGRTPQKPSSSPLMRSLP
jgi:predicted CoA-binding protein